MAWVIVILWALGVAAFLVYFFRNFGGLRGFLLWVLGFVVFIAVAGLQVSLADNASYRHFVEGASYIGWGILVLAATVLVADIAAMVIYTIRQGDSDDLKGKVITENRVIGSISSFAPGISKLKILGSKSEFITMESLLDGSATFGERMIVLGIITLFISFFSIFLGIGLMLMKDLVISVLFPVIPGIYVYRFARDAWQDYQKAKKRVAARRRGEQVDAPAEESHGPHGRTSKHT
jgi:hypothetical protein